MPRDEEDSSSGSTPSPSQPEDQAAIEALQADLEAFKTEVRERTVPRADLEADLKQYVRNRMRHGHARGWGPYLVLLYGTGMTIGAFYFLQGVWAILSMIVIWLSTLGLYALMLIVGTAFNLLDTPGRALDLLREHRRRR